MVERSGRLVVVDSVVGGTPPTARDLLGEDGETLVTEPYPRESGDSESLAMSPLTLDSRLHRDAEEGNSATLEAPSPPRRALAQSPIATPPGVLRNVATTVCSDRRDADGRLQWTTARWFDVKGPRTIPLSQKAEPQLGFAALALLAGAVFAVIFAVAFGFVGMVVLVIAGSSLRQAKPAVTAWIDRLAQA
ncbi:MAG: hypothetical protein ABIO20_00465 [Sphingomonas sp.]